MDPEASFSTLTETNTQAPAPRRTRRGRKRAHFSVVPRMPLPVKELWEHASTEEKARAHRTCCVMLQHWLGRLSRSEAASQLEIPALRVWQLSQQALAGMV